MRSRIVTILAVISVASPAWALDQSSHREVTVEVCEAAGLPSAFCARVGTEAYNVDHHEWDVMAAHGQPEPGQSLCDAANATASRVLQLADELAHALHTPATGTRALELARGLGRVLHTVQDNCAHAGISNAHHAWLSLHDTCEGTETSPDHASEALQCAIDETRTIITELVAALARAGVDRSTLATIDPSTGRFPTRDGVCEFLHGAADWDGIDRRWNNAWVTQALREHFHAGITGELTTIRLACSGNGAELFRPADDRVDVSEGPTTCTRIDTFCLGKTDVDDEAPPWHSDQDSENVAGCSATSAGGSWSMALLPLLLALVGRASPARGPASRRRDRRPAP